VCLTIPIIPPAEYGEVGAMRQRIQSRLARYRHAGALVP
jgi:hypothetical protein